MAARAELLAAASATLTGHADAPDAVATIDSWKPASWKRALLELPIDEREHQDRFLVERREEIERLWAWWSDERDRAELTPQTVGCLGFYLLTLVAMHCSDRTRFRGEPAASITLADTDAASISARLVEDERVRHAIERLHSPHPGRTGSSARTREGWKKIDFDSLAFHRHGTTSIILTGRSAKPESSRSPRFAFKCVIYPYQKLPAVAKATRSYAADYGLAVAADSPLVGVWASHDNWILMDFLPGQTLAERLAERRAGRSAPRSEAIEPADVTELDKVGTALLYALSKLEEEGHHHHDLTPSNIIVQEDGELAEVRIRLVDLGINHLHTRSLSGAARGETAYVAPEVRAEGRGDERSDLYSLGVLLVAIGGGDLNPDGTLPDRCYVMSMGMARLLEDLVDTDPDRRLLVTPMEAGRNRFEQVGELFRNEMEVLHESVRTAPVGVLEKLKSLSPGAGTVARQRRIMQVRKGHTGDSAHLRQARRLLRWAWAAAIILWCTAAVVVTWWARDLGISWQAKWLELLNNVFNRSGPGMVFFDDIRAEDYPIPDVWGNLPARLVGATFTLVNARLYLNIFAGLSPASSLPRRGMLRVRTFATEFMLRSFAILPSVCVLVPTLVQRDWWPLATQAGLVLAVVLVSVCLWFEKDTHRRAREAGLSTVPAAEFSPGRLSRWRPTLLVYCVAVLSIGTLIMADAVHDELVYAGFVSLINLSIYYFKSAGADAPRVRTELSRAFLAAERLDHLEAERGRTVPEPRSAPVAADART
ncbi:MAG TPA: protein kinase [Glycomyces sp.]|nr:protein kinase [Glycomyces sp.]